MCSISLSFPFLKWVCVVTANFGVRTLLSNLGENLGPTQKSEPRNLLSRTEKKKITHPRFHLVKLTNIWIPNNVYETLKDNNWKKAMLEEINDLEKK